MRITAQNLMNIKPQLTDLLTSLEVGDVVRGRIMEIFGESISLKTSSGEVLMAALATEAELKPGQSVELVISNVSEEGIFAELKQDAPKQVKMTEDVKLQQVLVQMDIKPEEGNILAGKLLLKYNMPITKENIHQLVNTQRSIETMAQGDAAKALSLMQSEIDINHTTFTKLAKHAAVFEQQSGQTIKAIQQDIPVDVKISDTDAPKIIVTEKISSTPMTDMDSAVEAKQNQGKLPQTDVKQMPQTMKQLVGQLEAEELQKAALKVEKLIDTVVKLFETAAKVTPEHSAYLLSKEVEVTPAAVKFMTDHVFNQGKLGPQLQELEKLVEVLEKNGAEVEDIKQEIKKVFLKPEALQDKEQVQETIKDIIKTAEKLESLVREHGLEDKVERSVFSDIKNSMDFMKNINTSLNYMQIPLFVNENKTTADIYVFSGKKKNKAINPENASIVIALDLKALGHIESLIRIYKQSVNVTFKVEKDAFKQLILDSGEALKQSLEARGYSLNTIQVIDMGERFSLLELEELTQQAPGNMHFDIKV